MWLMVLLVWLTIYRATRLITDDDFPASIAVRGRVTDRWGENSWQNYLVTCPWCLSIWLGAVVVVAADFMLDDGLAAPALVWASASAVTGYLSVLEPE